MALQIKLRVLPENEVRRFNLDAPVTFASLRQRVAQLLGRDNVRLFWQDNDGDMVVCATEEEFHIARGFVDNQGLLRLYAHPAPRSTTNQENGKAVHIHVRCDGCDGDVVGTRYKCLECADYDLCEGCEAKSLHRDHNMIAIRRPDDSTWKKFLGMNRGPCAPGPRGPCGPGRQGRPWGPGGPVPPFAAGPCGPQRPWGPPFMGGPCGGPAMFMRGPLGHFVKNLGQTMEMDIDLNRPFPEIIAEVTKKIQEAVEKAKNPSVGEESKKDETTVQPDPTANDAVIATAMAAAEIVSNVADVINETFVAASQEPAASESDGEWTHVQAETQPTTPPKEDTAAAGASNDEPAKKTEEPKQPENRVQAALKAMEEMGFTNEGNLLRKLLENYNGDVSRVLDAIK